MVGTLAAIIGLSTLFFTVILSLTASLSLMTLGILVVAFNISQWLISPYIINALYRVKEIPEHENPRLHEIVDNLSRKSGIKKPRLMLARILKTLETEEVEAVIGHELGHLKHRDVQLMMFVSILPALLYYIGYSLMLSSMFGRQKEGGGGAALLAIGFMIFSWILNIFILYLSRLREYYADRHSASIVEDGPRKLSEGLAKIVHSTKNMRRTQKQTQHLNAFKALFIADPDKAETDSMAISHAAVPSDQKLVQDILSRRMTTVDRIIEVFSTHPNIVKRLKALQRLS